MVEHHPTSPKDLSRLHQFGPKVLPGKFLGYVLSAGGIWKGDIMVAEIEELEVTDASELPARRLNAMEVLTPMKGEKFIFPVADGAVKISGGDQDLRTSTFIRDNPDRKRSRYSSRRIRSVFFNFTTRLIMAWWWSQKWFLVYLTRFQLPSSCGTPSQTVRADWRIIPYSTEIRWRYQNYRHNFGCDVVETYWRLLERWWRKRIVGCMERFHEIHFIEWKSHLMDLHGPGGDWRGNKRPQDPTMCGQICGNICLMHQNVKRSKSGPSRNRNSIMPDDCVVFTSLILMIRNSRISWRMLVEIWKFRCQQQCPVEFNFISTGKPVAQSDNARRNMLALWRTDIIPWPCFFGLYSTRIRLTSLQGQSLNRLRHVTDD